MNGKARSGLANGALLVGTLAVIFAICEAGIRIIESAREMREDPATSWAIYDEHAGYRMRPGVGDVNADGLRGPPVDSPKRRFRILMLGDSVAYYGDDAGDTFPGRLARALAGNAQLAPVEVLNAGIRGYTNFQELMFLEHHGIALAPDLVGVGFVLNDLHHVLHQFEFVDGRIVGERYAFSEEAVRSVDSTLYQLARRSHFLVWLRRQLRVFDDLIELYAGNRFSFDYRPDFANAWRESSWPVIEAQLQAMADLGRRHGFRVFVVAFPFGEQLRADYLARDRAYVMLPQRKLGEIAARLGVPYLDLAPTLDLARDIDPDHIHLTKRGRAIAGEAIARFLVKERLVPGAQAPARP